MWFSLVVMVYHVICVPLIRLLRSPCVSVDFDSEFIKPAQNLSSSPPPLSAGPPGAAAAKAQPAFSFGHQPPGFSLQPQPDSSPSAAATQQAWRIMESLNLGPQPKPAAVSSFAVTQTASSSSVAPPTINQDFSTVNQADLEEFFPNVSQEPSSSQGGVSSFALAASQFRVDSALMEDFPSFSEAQGQSALGSLTIEDFDDFLNPSLMPEAGGGVSAACQPLAPPGPPSSSSTSAPGSTWMNYPHTIVNLLQNEGMMEASAGGGGPQPAVLDEYDVLTSADEDRLISLLNSGSQARFVSGHPT